MAALWALCHSSPSMRATVLTCRECRVRRAAPAPPRLPHPRLTSNVDRGFFLRLFIGLFGIVLVAALLVTVIEGPRDSVGEFFSTFLGGTSTGASRP